MKTHEEFINEMQINHPNIIVVGTYCGTRRKIEWVCSNCGEHQYWKGVNEKLKMSNDEFVDRLSAISPTIEPMEEYSGANTRVHVRCKTCGYDWSPKAIELLSGRGCRKCKYKMLAEKQRRTPDVFIQEMEQINPNIIILGTYTKAKDHIEVECRLCGRKWSPVASSLLSGTGCPSCSKKRSKKDQIPEGEI